MEKYDENYQPREMTIDHFINEINNRYTAKDKFDYAIWGVSDVAEKYTNIYYIIFLMLNW